MDINMRNDEFDISAYMKQVKRFPLLSREEENELAVAGQNGDMKARNKLVSHNLRFALFQARKYRQYCLGRNSINFKDLVQAANEGLMKAVDKFDPSRGFKFTTFAVWWINACIRMYVRDGWSEIRIGTTNSHRNLFFKQTEIKALGDVPKPERAQARQALAEKLGVSVSDIELMSTRLNERYMGWDTPVSRRMESDGDSTIANFIPCDGGQEEFVEKNERAALVQKAMLGLSDREKKILSKRFFDESTLQSIGDDEGVTRERIRQIEQGALKEIRARLKLMGVESIDD